MKNVYILSDYGKLSKQNEHLLYSNHKGETRSIHLFNTGMLVLTGAVTITAETFQLLSKNKIPVFIYGRGVANNIRLDYGCGKNVFLRVEC